MAISTNSIIHYTDTFTKLESILKEGFAIKYCSEKLIIEGGGSQAAHPMISFCDIPLSQSFKHFGTYGRYGIGLSKVWANELGINPVLYLESKGYVSKVLGGLLAERRKTSGNLTAEQKDSILKIKAFAKNYSGPLKRKQIDEKNYRFYDEREWRLIPDDSILNDAIFSVSLSYYEKDKKKYNDEIADIRYEFKPSDISYIIVNNTTEISKLINILRTEYATKCTAQELDILFSKICSTEQIESDY